RPGRIRRRRSGVTRGRRVEGKPRDEARYHKAKPHVVVDAQQVAAQPLIDYRSGAGPRGNGRTVEFGHGSNSLSSAGSPDVGTQSRFEGQYGGGRDPIQDTIR